MAAIVAAYDSRCSVCDGPIVADVDLIVCVDDEWIHEECEE